MPDEADGRGAWTSASGAPYDVLCPGRHLAHAAEKPSISEPRAKDAEFGEKVHKALMTRDPSQLSVPERKSYDACVDTEEAAMRKFFGLSKVTSVKTFREKRLWIEFGAFKHSGQLDVWHKLGSMALIVEYKSLYGDIDDSPYNLQLRDQVVLLSANDLMLDTVGVVKAQPPRDLDPVIAVYNGDDLELARAEVGKRVTASNQLDAPRHAGRRQCEFCNAKNKCQAYADWMASITPPELVGSTNPVALWTPEQWTVFLKNKTAIEKFVDNAYSTAKEILRQDPDAIPGYRLADSGSVTKITDLNMLFNRFKEIGGKDEDFMGCLDLMIGRFEEALSKTTGATGVKLQKAKESLFSEIALEVPKAKTIRKVKKC